MNTALYKVRKALWVCVRCGSQAWHKPDGSLSALCGIHLRKQGGYVKIKRPDDSPDALPYQAERPRPPYVPYREPVIHLKVDHLTIPDHSWGINKYTAKSVLMQIEQFLFEANAKQEDQEGQKGREE